MIPCRRNCALVILCCFSLSSGLTAAPLVEPGNVQLRHDLQLLNDDGVLNVPLTAWPISATDLEIAMQRSEFAQLSTITRPAFMRVREFLQSRDTHGSLSPSYSLAAAVDPGFIRSFDDTPRDEGEVSGSLSWQGNRFSLRFEATAVANPFDNQDVRLDGSYVGATIGNWLLTTGWQERWWGPGRDGSLILSTNSRPTPGIMINRQVSKPFQSTWLRWLGPWTMTAFLTELDDSRAVRDARLFGLRGSIRPPGTGLEIGISRTAQWCGDNRPCDLSTFGDLLVGNDNRGVNVSPDDEPGNQLGGIDIRWRLPRQLPVAAYMQWIGEDGRGGGGAIGAWLRQLGVEFWGNHRDWSHRSHLEVSDTTCRQGGFGFSGPVPECGYEHSIYRSGYRYEGKSIGHALDRDGLSYSFGSTLVQSAGHSWNILLRYMEINRSGGTGGFHSLSPDVLNITDLQVTHRRITEFGQFDFGISFSDADAPHEHYVTSDVAGFVRWGSR